jgi:hypothetical protein
MERVTALYFNIYRQFYAENLQFLRKTFGFVTHGVTDLAANN